MSTSVFKASGPAASGNTRGPRVKFVKPFGTANPPKRSSIGPAPSMRNTIRFQGKHNLTCSACRDYGELTDCDTCRRAWHVRCVRGGGEPPLNINEKTPDFWRCPFCIGTADQFRVPGPNASKINTPIPDAKPGPAGRDQTASSLPSSATAQPTQTPALRRPSASPSDHGNKRRKVDSLAARSESEPTKGERRGPKPAMKSVLGHSNIPGRADGQAELPGAAAGEDGNGAPSTKPAVPSEPEQADDKPGQKPVPAGLLTKGLGGTTNANPNGILSPPLNPALVTSATAITSPSRHPQPPTALPALDTPTPSPQPISTPTNLITGLQLYLNQVCDKLVESEGTMQALERELEASKAMVRKMKEEKDQMEVENESLKSKLNAIKATIEG